MDDAKCCAGGIGGQTRGQDRGTEWVGRVEKGWEGSGWGHRGVGVKKGDKCVEMATRFLFGHRKTRNTCERWVVFG